ncbi:MAG: hypothetical protein AAFZ07_03935 [Actinomycetota bacterium]
MAAGILLAFVGDVAEVVAVAQQLGEFRVGDRAGGVPARSGDESPIRELIGERREGVVAGGVQLERERDQRSTLRIDDDGAYFAAIDPLPLVEVAELCSAECAALLGLLGHLVANVGAVLGRAVFVEARQDAVHELTDRALINAFGRGDELNAVVAEFHHRKCVIDTVPMEAAELVDDDRVYITFSSQTVEHGLEGRAFLSASPGLAWFDVFINDDDVVELFGSPFTGPALCGQRDAFGVVVGCDLGLRADTQVEDGASQGFDRSWIVRWLRSGERFSFEHFFVPLPTVTALFSTGHDGSPILALMF